MYSSIKSKGKLQRHHTPNRLIVERASLPGAAKQGILWTNLQNPTAATMTCSQALQVDLDWML